MKICKLTKRIRSVDKVIASLNYFNVTFLLRLQCYFPIRTVEKYVLSVDNIFWRFLLVIQRASKEHINTYFMKVLGITDNMFRVLSWNILTSSVDLLICIRHGKLTRWQGVKQDLRPNWYQPLNYPPIPWKVEQTTGVYVLYILRTALWDFFNVTQESKQRKSHETGPTVFCPYPIRLKCLTISRCQNKGSHSPQLF